MMIGAGMGGVAGADRRFRANAEASAIKKNNEIEALKAQAKVARKKRSNNIGTGLGNR